MENCPATPPPGKGKTARTASRGEACLARFALPQEIVSGLERAATLSLNERLRFWAEKFIGRPYIDSPLGDGDNRLRFDGFDCMTFVETCLALTISKSPDDVLRNLDRIRYRDGRVSFENRNHFVCADWLPNNNWLLKVEEELADNLVTRTIDRAKFFAEKGHPLQPNHPLAVPQEVSLRVASLEKLRKTEADSLNAKIALFVGNDDWLIVKHMGLTFCEDGNIVFIHASSVSERVVKVSLDEYVRGRNHIVGVSAVGLQENVI